MICRWFSATRLRRRCRRRFSSPRAATPRLTTIYFLPFPTIIPFISVIRFAITFTTRTAVLITFNIHFLESSVPPSVRVLLFNLQQLFIPIIVSACPCLLHYVVDFSPFPSWMTRIWWRRKLGSQSIWCSSQLTARYFLCQKFFNIFVFVD